VFISLLAVAVPQAQEHAKLVELARNGNAAEAWKQWKAMPASVERARTGVLIAAAAGEIGTGVKLYADLRAQSRKDEPAPLRALAIATAVKLTATPPDDVRLEACGVALQAKTRADACTDLLSAVRANKANREQQAIAVYRLANAGYRPWPEMFPGFQQNLADTTRLTIARTLTRLPAAERVAMAVAVFDAGNPAQQSAAASAIGDIKGPEALTALKRLADREVEYSVKLSVNLALARHGDAAALAFVEKLKSGLVGPRAVEASVLMGLAGSPYGADPRHMLEITKTTERARLALMVSRQQPELARSAVRGMMTEPAAPMREAGLRAAGQLAMGFDPAIYARLDDPDPAVRLAAVEAILQTIDG
jgi:hypothetical protein